MIEVTSFNNPWYHKMINKYQYGRNRDFDQLGEAIMVAGAFIAQSLDELTEAIEKNTKAKE